MKYTRKRKGFSLVELLVAIVVLGILGAITITAGTSAQRRARVTSAMTVFDDYKNAFNTAIMDHAGLVNDREDAWTEAMNNGMTYSSHEGFARLVGNMNRVLSNELSLVWNDTGKYWESVGNDPWGGKYVLLECPVDTDVSSDKEYYWDPTQAQNKACLRCSIWCTGNDPHIIVPEAGIVTIRDISIGISLRYETLYQDPTTGVRRETGIHYTTHGAQDGDMPYIDQTIHVQ